MSRHDISGILVKYAQARTKRAQGAPSGSSLFPSGGPLAEGTEQSTTPGSTAATVGGALGGWTAGRAAEIATARLLTNLGFNRPLTQVFNRERMSDALAPLQGQDRSAVRDRFATIAGIDPTQNNSGSYRTFSPSGSHIQTINVQQDAGKNNATDDFARMMEDQKFNNPAADQRIERVTGNTTSTPTTGKDPKSSYTGYEIRPGEPAGGSMDFRRLGFYLPGTVNTRSLNSYAPGLKGVPGKAVHIGMKGLPLAALIAGAVAANKATEGTGPVQFKDFEGF